MDKEILMWRNKAAEAERNRQSANNKALKLENQLAAANKALREAEALFKKLAKADVYDSHGFLTDDRNKFNRNEFVQAENMMRRASASIAPTMQMGDVVTAVRNEPPDDPKTNDHYFDGQTHWWFYLGNWHEERKA